MKILAYVSPARGHLFPTVPILQEAQRRGHDVVLRAMAAEVPRMRALGLRASAVSPKIEEIEHDDYRARGQLAALKRGVATFARRAAIEVGEVQHAIVEEQPDLLLVDTATWGAAAVAEAWGGAWALVQHFPTPLPADDVPPFGPGLKPGSGTVARLRNRGLRPLALGALERAVLPTLNEVRRAAGAAPVGNAHDLYTRPPLTLYLTSTLFEYPRREWPASFCFVGPITWDPPAEAPGWLADLVRPVVLVTTSSEFQDDVALVRVALAGLAGADVDVVATMPAGVPADMAVPSNARLASFLPHSLVLERASVAVTHGGMGATQKALCAGVPVVVVPWGRDQAEVGRRAEAAGVGVFLPKRKLSPSRLRDAVEQARALKPAAEAFAAEMATQGGAALAVDQLERLAARARSTTSPR